MTITQLKNPNNPFQDYGAVHLLLFVDDVSWCRFPTATPLNKGMFLVLGEVQNVCNRKRDCVIPIDCPPEQPMDESIPSNTKPVHVVSLKGVVSRPDQPRLHPIHDLRNRPEVPDGPLEPVETGLNHVAVADNVANHLDHFRRQDSVSLSHLPALLELLNGGIDHVDDPPLRFP
jgi:hypothetical protein